MKLRFKKLKEDTTPDQVISNDNVQDTSSSELKSLWDSQAEDSVTYRPTDEFLVKSVDNGKFEVYSLKNNKNTLVETFTSEEELNKKYTKVVDAQTTADGFTPYVSASTIEAIQYSGDSTIIHNGNEHASLMKGDYICKIPNGANFNYSVFHQSVFENKFEKTE